MTSTCRTLVRRTGGDLRRLVRSGRSWLALPAAAIAPLNDLPAVDLSIEAAEAAIADGVRSLRAALGARDELIAAASSALWAAWSSARASRHGSGRSRTLSWLRVEGSRCGARHAPQIGVLDPSVIDALVQSHITELPKAATRYTGLLSSTIGALSAASTVGS